MDLLLKLIAVQHPDSVDAAAAAHVSQPVSGDLSTTYLYKTPIYIFLIAFNSDADGQAFLGHIYTDIYTDTSLFKVITRTDAQGHFTTRLPAGYTYIPLWEAPSQDGRDGWFSYSRRTFDVAGFTPPSPVRIFA